MCAIVITRDFGFSAFPEFSFLYARMRVSLGHNRFILLFMSRASARKENFSVAPACLADRLYV